MKKIVITGGSGFVGSRFKKMWQEKYEILALSSRDLDVTDQAAIDRFMDEKKPDYVIHAAGIPSQQFCTEHPEKAHAVNVDGALYMAEACKRKRTKMVFTSTEQLFNGSPEPGPYTEESKPYPDTIYGQNKLEVEVLSYEGDIIEDIPVKRDSKYKAWVNIMYGCDKFCTYCIVPYTRGRERSRSKDDIIKEVEELVQEGYKEVTLLGQNVNAYGKDLGLDYTFGDLLYDLDKTGIERIRYTTSHPRDLDLKTMEAMRDCRSVMPHLHLPVQSGDNDILKIMNRKYTHEIYMEKVNKLKELVPGISITTDIIVGFPNETEEQFLHTLDLCHEAGFEGAFTFIYSKREGTPAARMVDHTSDEEKKERLNRLIAVTNEGYLKGHERFVGQVVKVLVDGESKNGDGMMCGYSEHNKLTHFKSDDLSLIGKIVNVKVTEAKTWFMIGELCE